MAKNVFSRHYGTFLFAQLYGMLSLAIVSMGHRIEGNLHYEHHNISFTGW